MKLFETLVSLLLLSFGCSLVLVNALQPSVEISDSGRFVSQLFNAVIWILQEGRDDVEIGVINVVVVELSNS